MSLYNCRKCATSVSDGLLNCRDCGEDLPFLSKADLDLHYKSSQLSALGDDCILLMLPTILVGVIAAFAVSWWYIAGASAISGALYMVRSNVNKRAAEIAVKMTYQKIAPVDNTHFRSPVPLQN